MCPPWKSCCPSCRASSRCCRACSPRKEQAVHDAEHVVRREQQGVGDGEPAVRGEQPAVRDAEPVVHCAEQAVDDGEQALHVQNIFCMTDSRLSGRENRLCMSKTCSASTIACSASLIACSASPTACSASLLRYLICRHPVLPSLERALLSGDRALPAPLVVFRASVRSHYLYSRALTSDQLQLHGINALN